MSDDNNTTTTGTRGYAVGQGAPITAHFSQRSASKDAGFVLPYLKPSSRVLDIGSGPGSITCDFASLLAAGSGYVVGVDFSPVAVSNACAAANKRGLSNVEFHVADIKNGLPFESGTFDVVFCHQLLSHLNDPVGALREMKRLAKPDGFVAVRETVETYWYPATPKLSWYVHWIREAFVRAGSKDANVAQRLPGYAQEAGLSETKKMTGSISGQAVTSEKEKKRVLEGSKILLGEEGSLRSNAIEAGATIEELKDIFVDLEAWGENPNSWMTWLAIEMVWQI